MSRGGEAATLFEGETSRLVRVQAERQVLRRVASPGRAGAVRRAGPRGRAGPRLPAGFLSPRRMVREPQPGVEYEDVGLDPLLAAPLPAHTVLRVGLRVAEILGELHARDLCTSSCSPRTSSPTCGTPTCACSAARRCARSMRLRSDCRSRSITPRPSSSVAPSWR
ncbi:hypothetical protein OV079_53205 [Nannocystis pusilla]|uniref:Uncharacterized protein n=1 Tax=Nannocystis pusilla TaxID=889268 RepID=A0A9X3F174_9BACT|nr:hypothetical protein [Nannocystis pusilla]MCY1014134.1 hypothetical protein [Nannocystis pusilla]